MDAHDVGASGDAQGGGRERALQPLVGGQVEHLADGRLAAGAEQHRPAERAQRGQVAQQLQVLLRRSCRSRCPDRRSGRPMRCPRAESRSSARCRSASTSATTLSIARLARSCIRTQWHAVAAAGEASRPTSAADAPDVVEQVRRPRRAPPRRPATWCVSMLSGMSGSAVADGTDDRHDAAQLLVARSHRAWPGRVDSPPMSRMSAPSAAIRRACRRPCRRILAIREQAVAAERVGRDVDDAHHVCAPPQ